MMLRCLLAVLLFSTSYLFAQGSTKIRWVEWSEGLFEKASTEKKLVLLDLEAVWCHWCHVMEEKTYGDPEIIKLISEKFIAVKVDQDSRPDIAARYEDYGWPATIIFNPQGRELEKLQGYIEAKELKEILSDKIKNPVPSEKERSSAFQATLLVSRLDPQLKAKLIERHSSHYDKKNGGWGNIHKFLFGNTEEYALRAGWKGDAEEEKRAKEALNKALDLIDPVWGGVYQYSVKTWSEPHFEKIAEKQYRNLYLYSLGYSLYKDPKYLKAAQAVYSYLIKFMKSPQGGFYTSQDADVIPGQHSEGYFKKSDADRKKLGIPRIDTNLYARENGWYIQGLLMLYAATGEEKVLADALTATNWVIKSRAFPEGGFYHGEKKETGFFLSDTLEMGIAFLKLYEVTGDRAWLNKAKLANRFISLRFSNHYDGKPFGFLSSSAPLAKEISAVATRDENVRVARFSNLLFHYLGDQEFKDIADQAMAYLLFSDHVLDRPTAGVLLADEEVSNPPVHITIVGSKKDPQAKKLFLSALSYPGTYKRVDWWDKTEGVLPNPDVKYPEMKKAAAFACTEGRCSLPAFDGTSLVRNLDGLFKKRS